MELLKQHGRKAAAALLLTALMLLLSAHADTAAEMLRGRVQLCLTTLIPSLFGCMVLGNLLCLSGAGTAAGYCLRRAAAPLRMPPPVCGIFLISQLAGYPVGGMLLRQATERGEISAQDAARFSYVCYGGGPAFLVGLAGRQLFGSTAAGVCILLSCIAANLTAALLLRPNTAPASDCSAFAGTRLPPAQALTASVTAAMKGMLQICGAVLLFGIIQCILVICGGAAAAEAVGSAAGIPPYTVRALLHTVLDVTQLTELFSCGLPFSVLLPLTAGLLSFGGCCVLLQCTALGVRTLRPAKLFAVRLGTGLLTAIFVRLSLPLLPAVPAQTVFVPARQPVLSQTGSFLPAFLIFLTGFPFLLKKD